MNALEKITNIAERVIKCIQNMKWWQSIRKDQKEYEMLWYEEKKFMEGFKVSVRQLFKVMIVSLPVGVGLGLLCMWLSQEVVPKIIALVFVIYFIMDSLKERKFKNPYTYDMIYMEDVINKVWDELAMKVVAPVTKEPTDVMDLEGKFDFILNSYTFTLFNEITDEIMIESMRQKLNKKFSKYTRYPLQSIRSESIISFNGKTIRIKNFNF